MSHVFLMIILGMTGLCQEDCRGRKCHFHHSVSSKDASFQHNLSLSILMWLRYCLSSFCSEKQHFLPFPHSTIWKEVIQYFHSQEIRHQAPFPPEYKCQVVCLEVLCLGDLSCLPYFFIYSATVLVNFLMP